MPKPTYTARGPVDLLAMVPWLLGFHPRDSLVVLTFGVPGGSFHARVDLPTRPEDQRCVADHVLRAVRHNGVPAVALVCYSTDPVASRAQCALLARRLRRAGVEVLLALRADGRRYYEVDEPADPGTAYDLAGHPFTLERAFEGDSVLGSREAVAATLVGPADEQTRTAAEEYADRVVEAVLGDPRAAAAVLQGEARWVQRRIRRHLRDHRPLPAVDAGRMLALAAVVSVRDVAWSEMTRATARDHVGLWRDLVRRCPRQLLPGAASLLAFAAWLAGDGALAWCAVDRALEADPDYSMAHRVADCLAGAVPPSVWSPVPEGELPVFAEDA